MVSVILFCFRYCSDGNVVGPCPLGFFCPAGTNADWQPCPRGTYNNETGLSDVSQCKPCEGGRYCGTLAASEPTGPCDAGHYCVYGVDRPRPSGNATFLDNSTCRLPGDETGEGGVCPQGHYCPQGTTRPLPCGTGTYSNETGAESCTQCPTGFYCLEGNILNRYILERLLMVRWVLGSIPHDGPIELFLIPAP